MTWKIYTWDYSADAEAKQRMLDKMANIEKFVVLVNEPRDEVIFVGDAADQSNTDQAIAIAGTLNRKGL